MANLPTWVTSGPPITPQQHRDATRYITRHAHDEADRQHLLAVLGLDTDKEEQR